MPRFFLPIIVPAALLALPALAAFLFHAFLPSKMSASANGRVVVTGWTIVSYEGVYISDWYNITAGDSYDYSKICIIETSGWLMLPGPALVVGELQTDRIRGYEKSGGVYKKITNSRFIAGPISMVAALVGYIFIGFKLWSIVFPGSRDKATSNKPTNGIGRANPLAK